MSIQVTTEMKGDILCATAVGTRTLDSVLAVARETLQACKAQDIDKVLVDVRQLEGRLGTVDAFELATRHFRTFRALRALRKAAIVDRASSATRARFLEDVAVNRGYNFRIFSDVEKAKEWLGD